MPRAALELARAEVPAYSLDAATLLSVDVRAAVRQIRNMLKAICVKNRPAS